MGCSTGGPLGGGVRSYAAIGLHATLLLSRTTGRHLHLELLGCDRPVPGDETGPLPGVLEYVAERFLAGREAVLRGEVLRLPMAPGGAMTVLYAVIPGYYDDAFASAVPENRSERTGPTSPWCGWRPSLPRRPTSWSSGTGRRASTSSSARTRTCWTRPARRRRSADRQSVAASPLAGPRIRRALCRVRRVEVSRGPRVAAAKP